jgi:3-phytase
MGHVPSNTSRQSFGVFWFARPLVRTPNLTRHADKRMYGASRAVAHAALAITASLGLIAPANAVAINVTALTGEVESDWSAVYYSRCKPLIFGNDGGSNTGGYHAWALGHTSPLAEVAVSAEGRTKLISTVYDIAGKDYAITIAQTDSILRAIQLPGFVEIDSANRLALGDWSALCTWKSNSGNQYFFLFGKRQAVQFLIREHGGALEIVEVSGTKGGGGVALCG